MVRVSLAASLAAAAAGLPAETGTMRQLFDELTRFGTRVPLERYPQGHWEAITGCMATAGDQLYPAASDAAWAGWAQFGIQGGAPNDPWDANNTDSSYKEYDPRNLTHQGHQIPIIEPCNTLSNLAYYRIIPDLCAVRANLSMDDSYVNAIIQGFAMLGMGSSFMHGSHTQLGCVFDNAPIDVIAYQYLQYMNSALKAPNSSSASILYELSAKPRAYDGRELAVKIHTIPLEEDVDDWLAALNKLDRPQYFFTFSAIIVNSLTLMLPDWIVDKVVPLAMSAFGLEPDVRAFIEDKYLPTIREATADVHLTLSEKAALLPKFAGTIMKLLWAFVWQEEIFPYKFLYNTEWNLLGALLIPAVNRLGNRLTGFLHPDDSIQQGESVYPGQSSCKLKHTAPHAKWHEASANGLMDLGYLSDHVKAVIDSAHGRPAQMEGDASIPVEVVQAWAAEVAALPVTESSDANAALVTVVGRMVDEVDACAGVADGEISASDLACYVEGISNREDFVNHLFESISDAMPAAQSEPLLV
jgi:hypothetical protein